ncbi:hypothetical protein D050_0600 [Vibrio parahaemolyticus VPCR-2009]|nr:hypothetical protein D050_0600 [Vibrio parahaemolyticus VPCR-2009]
MTQTTCNSRQANTLEKAGLRTGFFMGDETEFKIRFEVLVVFGAGNA